MPTKLEILQNTFGYEAFRPGQEEIIDAVLSPDVKGVLGIMPTSGGKSLLFQVPALMGDKISVVVSPLISLMYDQVTPLKEKGVTAEYYNSSMSDKEKDEVVNKIQLGLVQLLYVAPERFDDLGFLNLLQDVGVNIFAIDEAHCISQYGHDFRTAYRRIKNAIEHIKPNQVLAVTATATEAVQEDICIQLGIPNAKRFVLGFYRTNLAIKIKECEGKRINEVADQVNFYYRKGIQTGIIYTGTKKDAECIAKMLNEDYQVRAGFYHAGMPSDERTFIQDNWAEHGGIIVATCAFGMGIDRPDVRFVVHATMPGNIESWYQEIGRAGRDGNLSICKMFINLQQDLYLQNYFISLTCPPSQTVESFWHWINRYSRTQSQIDMTQKEMARLSGIEETFVSSCINVLKKQGLIKTVGRGSYLVEHDADNSVQLNLEPLEARRKAKKARLDQMVNFISNKKKCRMLSVLKYFGDYSTSQPCGICDICQGKKKNIDT